MNMICFTENLYREVYEDTGDSVHIFFHSELDCGTNKINKVFSKTIVKDKKVYSFEWQDGRWVQIK